MRDEVHDLYPNTGVTSRIPISIFGESNSNRIRQVLSTVKLSTCKNYKLALKPIKDIMKIRLEEERVNNTESAQEYPKRITIMF